MTKKGKGQGVEAGVLSVAGLLRLHIRLKAEG